MLHILDSTYYCIGVVRVHLLCFFLRIKDHLLDVGIVNGRILNGFASIATIVVDDRGLSAAGKGAVGEQTDEEEAPEDDANSAAWRLLDMNIHTTREGTHRKQKRLHVLPKARGP